MFRPVPKECVVEEWREENYGGQPANPGSSPGRMAIKTKCVCASHAGGEWSRWADLLSEPRRGISSQHAVSGC